VILVFDYAFGEQAFEVMDELLRPYEVKGEVYMMKVKSVSIMGKAGILTGGKGDIMIRLLTSLKVLLIIMSSKML
jgi:hypothetical protein